MMTPKTRKNRIIKSPLVDFIPPLNRTNPAVCAAIRRRCQIYIQPAGQVCRQRPRSAHRGRQRRRPSGKETQDPKWWGWLYSCRCATVPGRLESRRTTTILHAGCFLRCAAAEEAYTGDHCRRWIPPRKKSDVERGGVRGRVG